MGIESSSANFGQMIQNFVKLYCFDNQNYTRWVDKVKFFA